MNKVHGTVATIERPAQSRKIFENEKPPDFANEEWRKFDESAKKQFWRTDPILLFAEKCPETLGADEHNQTGILTPASYLIPPSRSDDQWLWNL